MLIGIYIICMLVFPICILIPTVRQKEQREELLSIENSNVIKGIAICFVMLAHLVDVLAKSRSVGILKIYTVLGGMGVLLFFFLSAYGLFKGYSSKTPNKTYLVKRLKSVVFPYVFIKTTYFVFLTIISHEKMGIKEFFLNYTDWFIVVILIEYLIFYVTWNVSYRTKIKCLVLMNFFLSILLAIIFWKLGFVARWYNGVLLFPFGMLVAKYEKHILRFLKSKYTFKFMTSILIFIVLGSLFTLFKGELWADAIKMVAGMFLAVITCAIFMKFELKTKIMQYIGKMSLYFYIIHLCVMNVLSMYKVDAIFYFYITILLTIILVWIYKKIVDFVL